MRWYGDVTGLHHTEQLMTGNLFVVFAPPFSRLPHQTLLTMFLLTLQLLAPSSYC